MIESDLAHVTADAVKTALTGLAGYYGVHCTRMFRAWRNRSPVTQSHWYRAAAAILAKTAASMADRECLAAALYVACSECSNPDGTFDAADQTPAGWALIAKRAAIHSRRSPEKALSRGRYEARRDLRRVSHAEVCHKLFTVLQIWRTGKAGERADIWQVTEEAERAYRTLFPHGPTKNRRGCI